MLQRKRARKEEQAKKEAILSQVQKVKTIAWIPELSAGGEKLKNHDGSLQGKYIVQYEETYKDTNNCNKKRLVEVPVTTAWAEENFGIATLAYAQQVAYDRLKQKEAINKSGRIMRVTGFVSCENYNVSITPNKSILMSIRYQPWKLNKKG